MKSVYKKSVRRRSSAKRNQNLVRLAIQKGGALYANISGGKDGQAMLSFLHRSGFEMAGAVHADLGRIEWAESIIQCKKNCYSAGRLKLHVVRRSDKLDMVDYWARRMRMMKGTGKPFWSSSEARYCTSDLKRGPIGVFYTRMNKEHGHNLIISCEGIRAQESTKRAKKKQLSIKSGSSSFYKGMSVKKALENYRPDKRLVLEWYPIFEWTIDQVWAEGGNSAQQLEQFRAEYNLTGIVNPLWNFHPAYVYGNERVSCKFCVLAKEKDLLVGSKHDPENILLELISMEHEGNCTFKNGWSLSSLINH